jgi:hypothetical protein
MGYKLLPEKQKNYESTKIEINIFVKFGKFGTDLMNYEYQRNQDGNTKISGQCT